jgi:L-methionine (R)-S-oxide reductase
MAEDFLVIKGNKEAQYKELLPQIKSMISAEEDLIANLANICAMLKTQFNWWWVGFYIVKQNSLVLGPFQGPLACTRIALGKGVCGSSWAQKQTIVVNDVDTFPGHIACSSVSKSEIVVPIIRDENVVAVLDVDSEYLSHFDEVDKLFLEELVGGIEWIIDNG